MMESFKKTLKADISEQLPTLSQEDVEDLLDKILEVVDGIKDLPHVEPSDLQPPLKKATAKRFVTYLQTKYGEPNKKVDLQPIHNMEQLAKPTGNKPKVPTKPQMNSLKVRPKLPPKPKSSMPSSHGSPSTGRPIKTHPADKTNFDKDARFPSTSDDTGGKRVEINKKPPVEQCVSTAEMEGDLCASAASSNLKIQRGAITNYRQKSSGKMAQSDDLSSVEPKHLAETVSSLSRSQALRVKRRPCIPPHFQHRKHSSDCGLNSSSASRTEDKPARRSAPDSIAPDLSKYKLKSAEGNYRSQESAQTEICSPGLKGSLPDSNHTGGDEDPMTSDLPQYKVYMQSFSVGQKDLVSKVSYFDRLRSSSAEYDGSSTRLKKDHAGATARIDNDITSFGEEPIYSQVYESVLIRPKRYLNDDDGDDDDVDIWGSDEFDSDEFSDGDSVDGINQDESSPAEKQAMKARKRKQIATELLTTERAYVKRLHLIDQEFHLKMVIENRSHQMFPDDVIPQMFSNIKSIYQFHNDFLLPQLEKRMADWDNTPKIGDLMSKFAPFLKLYSEYVKNFGHAIKTITRWQQRSTRFADLLAELQKNAECGMLSLQHHMLEPIQRVPRYKLLLTDYLKYLEKDSEDRPDTEKALDLVNTAAARANETMAKPEKFWRLLELNQMFRWRCDGAVDLSDTPRELLKEGQIFKISARNGKQITRYLFLFNDMLLVCTDYRKLGSYHVHNVLKVDSMQVLEGDNTESPFTFYVETSSQILELQGRTQEEKHEWFSTLQTVIKDGPMVQHPTERDHRLGHFAPRWVKDQNTSTCMTCSAIFSIINRRHHCRCCGIVVCGECSSQKVPLPYQDNKPSRVCGKCYEALKLQTDALQVKGSDPSVVSGMMLMSSDKKIWERRWFALHENFVLYSFKTPQDMQALTSTSLPGYTVSEATEVDNVDKECVIKISHSDDTVLMYIHSHDSWIKWLTALQCAVSEELPPSYVSVQKEVQTFIKPFMFET